MNNDTFQWTDLLACEWAGYLEEQLKVKSIMDMQSILFQWKQSKTPPKKDRIVVVRIQDITYSSSNHNTLFTTTSRINPDKFEAIKEAIERVLNDEGGNAQYSLSLVKEKLEISISDPELMPKKVVVNGIEYIIR